MANRTGGKTSSTATFTLDDRELRANLAAFDTKVRMAMAGAVSFNAPRAEAWARSNAKWTDRTGNARNGLTARPEISANGHLARIVVAHSVPYGIWLEVRNSGALGIIKPTIDHFLPQVLATVGRLFKP